MEQGRPWKRTVQHTLGFLTNPQPNSLACLLLPQ
jgi:hypothetical protein